MLYPFVQFNIHAEILKLFLRLEPDTLEPNIHILSTRCWHAFHLCSIYFHVPLFQYSSPLLQDLFKFFPGQLTEKNKMHYNPSIFTYSTSASITRSKSYRLKIDPWWSLTTMRNTFIIPTLVFTLSFALSYISINSQIQFSGTFFFLIHLHISCLVIRSYRLMNTMCIPQCFFISHLNANIASVIPLSDM